MSHLARVQTLPTSQKNGAKVIEYSKSYHNDGSHFSEKPQDVSIYQTGVGLSFRFLCNRTEWSPIQFVIIRVIMKIGQL